MNPHFSISAVRFPCSCQPSIPPSYTTFYFSQQQFPQDLGKYFLNIILHNFKEVYHLLSFYRTSIQAVHETPLHFHSELKTKPTSATSSSQPHSTIILWAFTLVHIWVHFEVHRQVMQSGKCHNSSGLLISAIPRAIFGTPQSMQRPDPALRCIIRYISTSARQPIAPQ